MSTTYNTKQSLKLDEDDIVAASALAEELGLFLQDVLKASLRHGLAHFRKKPMSLVKARAERMKKKKAAKKPATGRKS